MSSEELRAIFDQLIKEHGDQGIYIAIRAMNDLAYDKTVVGSKDPVWSSLKNQLESVLWTAPEGYYVQVKDPNTFCCRLPPRIDGTVRRLCEAGVRDFWDLLPIPSRVSWGEFAALIKKMNWSFEGTRRIAIAAAEAMEEAQREIDRLSS